jgi:dTDP-6-deoxy-L-talose 4-dehydrogenase (NAD+)
MIVITGANGFIGSNIKKYLHNAGVDNIIGLSSNILDLTDLTAVKGYFSKNKPTVFIHCAAVGLKHSDAKSEIVNSKNILMAEILHFVLPSSTKIIVLGSASEYGEYSENIKESSPCNPVSEYGKSKLRCSEIWRERHRANGNVTLLRLFGIYGPGESQSRLFPFLTMQSQFEGEIKVSHGRQRRDFVWIHDLCRLIYKISTMSIEPFAVNVGTGQEVVVKDVILAYARYLGLDISRLRFGSLPQNPHDVDRIVADTSILKSLDVGVPSQRLISKMASERVFSVMQKEFSKI